LGQILSIEPHGAEPGCSWLPKGIARDKLGCILTGTDVLQSGAWPLKDREPCPLETSLPGILAAGDIRWFDEARRLRGGRWFFSSDVFTSSSKFAVEA